MKRPSIKKVGLLPKEAALKDSLEGNPPITWGNLMEVDEVQWLEQGMKMPRAIKDKDDERLVFQAYEENNS